MHGFRELLTTALLANLAQTSVRQNEDMRRISAWVAILAVPTAVAGIYGMNFEHMPELKSELEHRRCCVHPDRVRGAPPALQACRLVVNAGLPTAQVRKTKTQRARPIARTLRLISPSGSPAGP